MFQYFLPSSGSPIAVVVDSTVTQPPTPKLARMRPVRLEFDEPPPTPSVPALYPRKAGESAKIVVSAKLEKAKSTIQEVVNMEFDVPVSSQNSKLNQSTRYDSDSYIPKQFSMMPFQTVWSS